MKGKNLKQVFAIQGEAEKRIIKAFSDPSEASGIYIFSRYSDEKDKHCVYVGQAKNLRQRIAQHLLEYDHLAVSLKKHGLYNKEDKPSGWQCHWQYVVVEKLDEQERQMISSYAHSNCELYNVTSGGQGKGKTDINPRAARKGYIKGKQEGYTKAYAEISELISKYTSGLTSKGGKLADRKTAELIEKLGVMKNE